MERKPMVPEKGALTIVFDNWACMSCDSALAD